MSRTLPMEAFEEWLYNDEYVIARIVDNEVILELFSINLKTKDAIAEVEAFCFRYFDREDCLVEVVRSNCEMVLGKYDDESITAFIENISHFYNWDDEYFLIHQVYWFENDLDLARCGDYSMSEIRVRIIDFAQRVAYKLSVKDESERRSTLKKGVDLSIPNATQRQNPILNKSKEEVGLFTPNPIQLPNFFLTKSKKWFEFWK